MRRLTTTLLLLLQLGPLAGAGICIRAAAQSANGCVLPMQGMTPDDGQPHSSPAQDCPLMIVCAPTAPMIAVTVQMFGVARPASTDYSTPASLLPGDPIAPPQRPPIV